MSRQPAADLIITSPSVFDGDQAAPGFVAVRGSRILHVGSEGEDLSELIGPGTEVFEASGTITPGLHDNHTFFTSALLEHGGINARGLHDDDVNALARAAATRSGRPASADDSGRPADAGEPSQTLVVTGLEGGIDRARRLVDALADGGQANVVALTDGRSGIHLSPAAAARFGSIDPTSNESLAGIYRELGRDERAVHDAFLSVGDTMLRAGVTSVKDIALDDYSGMHPTVDRLTTDQLPLRFAFASQPVERPADLAFAARAQHAKGARFHGFKLMTDGSFDEHTADLLPPDDTWRRQQRGEFDRDRVREEATRILAAGHRLALNADGDAAVRWCLDVFDAAIRNALTLPDGCSISDASLLDSPDAHRIARLDLTVETYTQMLRLDGYTPALLRDLLGPSREQHLANLNALMAADARITSGTDYPLFRPSLPESLLSASERLLPQSDTPWHPHLAITRLAVLRSWTSNAGAALGDDTLGRLHADTPADIAVFDTDLLAASPEELLEATTLLTLRDGTVRHTA